MVYGDSMVKAERLLEILHLFATNPSRAFRTAEVSERLGIPERSVRKYINELSASGKLPVYNERGRWRLVEGARLLTPPVRFQLEEATALYVAARQMVRRAAEPARAVGGAVTKLAGVVPVELKPAFERLASRTTGPEDRHARAFRDLAYGWAMSRVVKLVYRPRSSGNDRRLAFRPYLLEPSVVGSALYAVGLMEPPGEVRVLRLERIVSSTLTSIQFTPPEVEELMERVERSWGVWLTDDDPVTVRLKFSPSMADRVRETRWHPSQSLDDLDGGGVELKLTVTSTTDLLPWVLGWGGHCEVVAPREFRGRVAAELERGARLYRS